MAAHLPLSLLVGLLYDAREFLQLGALVQSDVLPGDDLLLHFGHLVAQRLFVFVHVVVVEMLLNLGQFHYKMFFRVCRRCFVSVMMTVMVMATVCAFPPVSWTRRLLTPGAV